MALVLFDVDGTMTSQQLFVEFLKQLAFHYPRIAELLKRAEPLYDKYKSRDGSYRDYINSLVIGFFHDRMYVGISETHLSEASVAAGKTCRKRMYRFTRTLLEAAKECNYGIIAISGSPYEAVKALLQDLPVDAIFATTFPKAVDGVIPDELVSEYVTDKGRAKPEIERRMGPIDPELSIAIDDTESGIPMLEMVDWHICFNPKQKLREEAESRNWPILLETQDSHYILEVDRFEGRQWLKRISDILPEPIGECVEKRLKDAGW